MPISNKLRALLAQQASQQTSAPETNNVHANTDEPGKEPAEEIAKNQLKAVDAYERLKICQSCDKYMTTARICGVCRCFMPVKTRMKRAKCPIGKW